MKFVPPLERGTLLRRYKRFLADVELADGQQITIHCPNTGSMRSCLAEGEPCWFSHSNNPRRKYSRTWEIATTPLGDLAGINTHRANALVVEGIERGVVDELQGYETLHREVRYGEERSRIDILLGRDTARCYVEVKNVTLCEGNGLGRFPDAISSRGARHLRELRLMAEAGNRAVLFYCAQHTGIEALAPAWDIDPEYCRELQLAVASGVEVLAYVASVGETEIALLRRVDFTLAAS